MIDLLLDPNAWAALVALSALEIVLGIDNVIFISVMVSRLPAAQSKRARQIGLALAFVFRIVLLFTLTWMMRLTAPLFTVFGMGISGRDTILIGGGLFLIAKATHEMHAEIEARDDPESGDEATQGKAFLWVVMQLAVVDLVFSLDSIITAIGMAQEIEIMIAAVVIAMIVMYVASGPVSALRRRASHHQDAGAGVPGADRRGAGRRRLRLPHPARLHLLRDGVCRRGRSRERDRRTQSQETPDAAFPRPPIGVVDASRRSLRPGDPYL